MKKIKNNKGFTLAELLIVVAIIAVLVAIMIPTFGGQLEKARESADLANLRAAYAEATIAYLNGSANGNAKKIEDDGSGGKNVTVSDCNFAQTDNEWTTSTSTLPFDLNGKMPNRDKHTVVFNFDKDGNVKVTSIS